MKVKIPFQIIKNEVRFNFTLINYYSQNFAPMATITNSGFSYGILYLQAETIVSKVFLGVLSLIITNVFLIY